MSKVIKKDRSVSYKEVKSCRITNSSNLITVLDLGVHAMSGIFPKARDLPVTKGPLELVWCPESGLLQLKHSYDPEEMYGPNYGYRSGLNGSMIQHLQDKARRLESRLSLQRGDIVLDIGSNDGTLLNAYQNKDLKRIGIDPTSGKFLEHYEKEVHVVEDFFTADRFYQVSDGRKARVITSIAMFYDLEDPNKFVSDIGECLSPDGIWHFEQSYLPSMLRMNSYDTICHEHLEYYSLQVVVDLLKRHNLKVIDVELNAVNGGSFGVTAVRDGSQAQGNPEIVEWILQQEKALGLATEEPYLSFAERVFAHRNNLQDLIYSLRDSGKKIAGYGASTKGNVLLQFCDFGPDEISCIAEVNPDKFGSFTPGTNIPIVSESEAKAERPDFMLVLPWHFRDGIIKRESEYLQSGGRLIFPLPEIEVI